MHDDDDIRDPKVGSLGACPISANWQQIRRELEAHIRRVTAEIERVSSATGIHVWYGRPEYEIPTPLPYCVRPCDWMRCTARTRSGGICRNRVAEEHDLYTYRAGRRMMDRIDGYHRHASAPDEWLWVPEIATRSERLHDWRSPQVEVKPLEIMTTGLCRIHGGAL